MPLIFLLGFSRLPSASTNFCSSCFIKVESIFCPSLMITFHYLVRLSVPWLDYSHSFSQPDFSSSLPGPREMELLPEQHLWDERPKTDWLNFILLMLHWLAMIIPQWTPLLELLAWDCFPLKMSSWKVTGPQPDQGPTGAAGGKEPWVSQHQFMTHWKPQSRM